MTFDDSLEIPNQKKFHEQLDVHEQPDVHERMKLAIASGDSELISALSFEMLNGTIEDHQPARFRLKDHQLNHYPSGWSFSSLPIDWFRTLAGALVTQARLSLRLSQKDFAASVGFPASSICRFENCRQDPTVGTLVRLLERAGFVLKVELIPVSRKIRD